MWTRNLMPMPLVSDGLLCGRKSISKTAIDSAPARSRRSQPSRAAGAAGRALCRLFLTKRRKSSAARRIGLPGNGGGARREESRDMSEQAGPVKWSRSVQSQTRAAKRDCAVCRWVRETWRRFSRT